MANENTNLVSMLSARQTTNTTSRTQNSLRTNRTNSNAKNSKSNLYQTSNSSRSQKNNFGKELDKANAHIDNAQSTDDTKVVAENVESESVNTLNKAPTQGKSTPPQDAPKQNLSGENPQQPTENISAKNVSEAIPAQLQPTALEETENILTNVNAQLDQPHDKSKIATEILINPVDDESVDTSENPLQIVPTDTDDEKSFSEDTTENSPTLGSSADMAYYFASSMNNILFVEDAPIATDAPNKNLMSIMPQTNDDKAQSMLNYLSGKTWESPKSTNENVPVQNLNLQSLTPQTDNQSANQALPIMPQYQPRPLNFRTTINPTQPTLQAEPTVEIQPKLIQQTINPQQNNLQQFNPQLVQQTVDTQNNLQQFNPQLVQQTVDAQNNLQQFNPQLVQQTVDAQNNLQQFNPQLVQQTVDTQNNLQQFNSQLVQSTVDAQNNLQQLNPQIQQTVDTQNNLQQFNPQLVQPTINSQQNNLQQFNPQIQQAVNPQQNNLQQFNPQLVQQTVQPNVDAQNNFQQFNPQLVQQTVQPTVDIQNNLQQINPQLVQQTVQPTVDAQPNLNQLQPQQQFGAQIQPQINSLQPQAEPRMVNQQTVNNMLGVEVQVDDNFQTSTPVMPLQSTTQYFEQNPQSARDFRQNFGEIILGQETQTSEQTTNVPEENFVGNLAAVNHTQNNQPAAQVQSPEVVQAPRDDFNVPAQIVEQARMIRTATNTEMVINLKPEHLGELTLRVSVTTNGAVTASFYSDNAQVRAIIENTIVQLKQELNDQGIKVDNVEVYAGLNEDSLLNGQGQQAWQQNQQRNHRGQQVDFEAVENEIDSLNPVVENQNISSEGVDYKV